MEKFFGGLLCITLLLIPNNVFCQETKKALARDSTYVKIQLKDATVEQKERYAVWRTDYYICTGIAYAKSVGQTVDDFAVFVAGKHNLGNGDNGLPPVVKLFHFVFESYPNGQFDIISETDSVVTMKSNRPYSASFNEGPVLGVTLDEFERFLYQHIRIMASNIGIDFAYHNEGDSMIFTLAKQK
jgi:hypothetical protein